MSNVYSFLDVTASIAGPGGVVSLKGDDDNGVSAEGIVVDPTGDKNVMTVGADGGVDTRDPQRTECPLLEGAVCIGIAQTLLDRIFRNGPNVSP